MRVNGGVSEISLHDIFLLFHLVFNSVEFNLLPLDVREVRVLRSQSVNIGNDPWIAEVEQGIVDHEAVVGGWVEDGEIRVLQP
jgi:hypothetical protein